MLTIERRDARDVAKRSHETTSQIFGLRLLDLGAVLGPSFGQNVSGLEIRSRVSTGDVTKLCLAARFRRLARDYERLQTTLKGLHYVAFAILMGTRLIKIALVTS